MEAKHQPQTDRHIRITRKIVVDLQHKQYCAKPAAQHSHLGEVPVHILNQKRSSDIGNCHFFEKAYAEPGDSVADVVDIGCTVIDLPSHIRVADDRACHQLEVHGYIHHKAEEGRLRLDLTPMDIHNVRNHLKGVEADANRQRELRNRQ